MNNSIIAIALALTTNIAAADGFQPWEARDVIIDPAQVQEVTAEAGFGPWRDRPVDVIENVTDVQITETAGSVFRPWS